MKPTLVGKWIHTYRPKGSIYDLPDYSPIDRQGKVISAITTAEKNKPALYEVQWFSWVNGEPTNSTIVSVETMHFEGWSFFDDEDKWLAKAQENNEIIKIKDI